MNCERCRRAVTRVGGDDGKWVNARAQAYCATSPTGRHTVAGDPFLISEASFPLNPQLPPPRFGS